MYYQRRRPQPAKKNLSVYLLPLAIILVGLLAIYFFVKGIGYLASLGGEDPTVELFVEQGRVEVFASDGTELSAIDSSGQSLFVGHTVKTGAKTRAVLLFNDTSQVRLAPNSELKIVDLKYTKSEVGFDLNLQNGEAWVSTDTTDPELDYDYVVSTPNLSVEALGTKFDLKAKLPEYVRVIEGEVSLDVKSRVKDDEYLSEGIPVGVAQQFVLTAKALAAFEESDAYDVVFPIDDDFELTSWYDWNTALDLNPTLALSFNGRTSLAGIGFSDGTDSEEEDEDSEDADAEGEDENSEDEDAEAEGEEDSSEDDDNAEDEEVVSEDTDDETVKLVPPKISSPKNGATVTEELIKIEGLTDPNTAKVEVTSYQNGKPNVYSLQRYTAGSTTWLYVATFSGGNLVEGENTYEVRAVAKDGTKSAPAVIKLNFKPSTPTESSAPVFTPVVR